MWACRTQVVCQILTHNTTGSSDAAGAGKEAFGGKKNREKNRMLTHNTTGSSDAAGAGKLAAEGEGCVRNDESDEH